MKKQHPGNRRNFLHDAWFQAGAPALAAGAMAYATPQEAGAEVAKLQRKPYVFVTLEGPEDGGDFGPHTPGTKTSGIQEALDYAHANSRDVYIFGGRGGMHQGEGVPLNIYTLYETLRVPWSQDFRLDGGNYILAYQKTTGHAIHVDSQMNCRYKFGLVTSNSQDAAVCIKPETAGPDDFKVITASIIDFSAVCSGHPQGTGILIDSSQGPIINSKIFAEETNTVGIGVHATDAGGVGHSISNNHIQVMYGNQYHARGHCTGLRLGDPGSRNIIHNKLEISLHAPRGAHLDPETKRYITAEDFIPEDAIGADIFAQSNVLTLTFYGKREPGHDIVFEPESRDNMILAFNLPNGLTNKAHVPTNRIIPTWTVGFDVLTPAIPASGESVVNTNPYTVQIIIVSPGEVSQWAINDAESSVQGTARNLSLVDNLRRGPGPAPSSAPLRSQTISAGFFAGQTVLLEPGETLSIKYTKPPNWRWKALT